MSHLDEGTLHALLDGELDLDEVSEIQMHLGSCVACGSRLQEVKQVLAEADRLVGAIETPAGSTPRQPPLPRTSAPSPRPFREPDPWEETPVLLLPDASEALARRRRRLRALRWAAMIAVVVGGGKVISSMLRSQGPLPASREVTTAMPEAPSPVASPEETNRRETVSTAAPSRAGRTVAQNRPPAAAKAAQPSKVMAAAKLSMDSARDKNNFKDSAPASADSGAVAGADSGPANEEATQLAAGALADSSPTDSAVPEAAQRQNDELATRRAAAAALAELDRERRRQRAAAATAALPAPRSDTQPAAESTPPQRTPEQKAQIYLRIGLDEATRQLGGPVHVIEGMTPQFIGLTQGRLVPGADVNRPVVRVVYLDSRGRMILLDQQRVRAGQAPSAAEGNLRWTVGDVMLYLRGEPSQDVLKNLQRRVR